jgi:hypothetical protein
MDADAAVLNAALYKSTSEFRDGLRACRDLLNAMKLSEQRPSGLHDFPEEEEVDAESQGTVRPAGSRI